MHRRRVRVRLLVLLLGRLLDLHVQPVLVRRALDGAEVVDGALEAALLPLQPLDHLVTELVAHELQPAPRIRHEMLRRLSAVVEEWVSLVAEQRDQRGLRQLRVVEDRRAASCCFGRCRGHAEYGLLCTGLCADGGLAPVDV